MKVNNIKSVQNSETNKTISDWIATALFAPYFFGLLLFFHPLHLLSRLFGNSAQEAVLLWMNHSFLWGLKVLAGLRLTVSISEEVPEGRPLILLSNHQSMYDITLILSLLERGSIKFVAKKELAKWLPSVSIALRNMQAALIDRKNRRQAVSAIRDLGKLAHKTKRSVCIFPEGTRSRDGSLRKFKISGVKSLIEEMPEALVCPVAVNDTWKILQFNFWPVKYGVHVTFTIGAPLQKELPVTEQMTLAQKFIESNIKASEVEKSTVKTAVGMSLKEENPA